MKNINGKNIGAAIHFANMYGLDKKSMQERLDWATNEGMEIARKIVNGHFPTEADKPFQAAIAAQAWIEENDRYDLVCHVDGTCNGLQHGAALVGHRKTAEAVNCTAATRSFRAITFPRRAASAAASCAR